MGDNEAAEAVAKVRGLLAAYGEAYGTPSDYEFLVSQIASALPPERVHHVDCPALYFVDLPERCRCAILAALDAAATREAGPS